MGSCVSSHKNLDSTTRKGSSVDSKAQNLLIPSATDEKPMKGENPNAESGDSNTMKSVADANIGTKEEAFFDSQAWLESDCEDDFVSVNGELSCSSTPNYQRSTSGKSQLNKVSSMDRLPHSKPEASPTDRKMRLSELFKESRQEEQVNDNQNAVNGNSVVKMTLLEICQKTSEDTPHVSGVNSMCSSETTPNIDAEQEKEEKLKVTHCCLPSFVHSLSFSERKQSSSHKENSTSG